MDYIELKKTYKVIILEDSESDAELMKLQLDGSEFNCEIKVVNNKKGFINVLKKFEPDLVLSDYSIPGYSGLHALKYLRLERPTTPFILITGSLGDERAVETILAGANDFLLKDNLENLPAAIIRSLRIASEQNARKEAIKSLKESELKFRGLIENSSDFIVVCDENSIIKYVSPAFQKKLNKESSEIENQSILDLIHPDDVSLRKKHIKALLDRKKETVQIVQRWILADGTIRWMESTISDQRQVPGICGFVCNIRDIHDYYVAREELLEKSTLMDAILNNLNEGVVTVDSNGRIFMANSAASELLGVNLNNGFTGKWNDVVNFYESPEGKKVNRKKMPYSLASKGETVHDKELFLKNDFLKEGVYLNVNARPLKSNDGQAPKGVISFSDISEKRRYQNELISTLESLEIKVKERTAALHEMHDELMDAHKQITHSIKYAQRIQQAVTVSENDFSGKRIEDFFLIDLPRDTVSGDFVWMNSGARNCTIAVADCTGHGVPGAMLSMIGNQVLDRIVVDRQIFRPEIVLEEMDKSITKIFTAKGPAQTMSDGMDMSICSLDIEENRLIFAGANNIGIVVQKGEIVVLEADRYSVGGHWGKHKKEFTRKIVNFEKGDRLYLFTDGFQDQFGGDNDKKFTKKRLLSLITDVQSSPMKAQQEKIMMTFNDWKGKEMQIDDVTVLGIEM